MVRDRIPLRIAVLWCYGDHDESESKTAVVTAIWLWEGVNRDTISVWCRSVYSLVTGVRKERVRNIVGVRGSESVMEVRARGGDGPCSSSKGFFETV